MPFVSILNSYLDRGLYKKVLEIASQTEIPPEIHLEALLGMGRFEEINQFLAQSHQTSPTFDALRIIARLENLLATDPTEFEREYRELYPGLSKTVMASDKLVQYDIRAVMLMVRHLIAHRRVAECVNLLHEGERRWSDSTIPSVLQAQILNYLSICNRLMDKIDLALEYGHEAISLLTETGNKSLFTMIYNNLGNAYIYKGSWQQALYYHEEALNYRLELGHPSDIAVSYTNIGTIYTETGELEEALGAFRQALAYDLQLGNKQNIAISTSNIGNALRLLGRYREAIEYLEDALSLEEKLGNSHGVAHVALNLVRIYIYQGKVDRAQNLIERYLDPLEYQGSDLDRRMLYIRKGRLFRLMGKYRQAFDHYYQALILSELSSNGNNISEPLFLIYQLRADIGDGHLGIDSHMASKLEASLQFLQRYNKTGFVPSRLVFIEIFKQQMSGTASPEHLALLLEEFHNYQVVDFEMQRFALLQEANLHLQLLPEEGSSLAELREITQKLMDLAEKHHSNSLFIHAFLLRAHVAIIQQNSEEVNAYFSLAKSMADEYDLVVLQAAVRKAIDQYATTLSDIDLFDSDVPLMEEHDPLGLFSFVQEIITDQLELLVLAQEKHLYDEYSNPLCGSSTNTASGLFCSRCRQLSLQLNLKKIVIRYLQNNPCSYCFRPLSVNDADQLIVEHLMSAPAIYNPLLEVSSALFGGVIEWKCRWPQCKSRDTFRLDLNEISQLFTSE